MVGEVIDAFIKDHVSSKLTAKTRVHYQGLLVKVRSAYGNLKAASLTRAHVAALHQSLVGTPYSANRTLAAVSY
ncbi:MAG TPA: hypothetical protein VFC11_06920 [Methylocella sp.]|nr:hypothetical protein [Methylocella sp.]